MNRSSVQNVGLLALVFVVAVAGVWFGMAATRRTAPVLVEEPLQSKLVEGSQFPDLPLVDVTGNTIQTGTLLGQHGTIVLFLEFGCPPCETMTARWQGLMDDGRMGEMTIVGITTAPPREIEPYQVEHGLRFPIYADTAFQFAGWYDVVNFPLMLALDGSGTIKWHTYDAQQEVTMSELLATVGE